MTVCLSHAKYMCIYVEELGTIIKVLEKKEEKWVGKETTRMNCGLTPTSTAFF